jgi:hypothetical protein
LLTDGLRMSDWQGSADEKNSANSPSEEAGP